MDTIVALSTPTGRGGIGVVRLSGNPLQIAREIFSSKEITGDEIMPKYMYFGRISANGFSDVGYMVYFKGPKSFTGEDVIEFHIHGGIKIAEGVIEACVERGARLADRGEFTRRAFLNGKMALSDAEGVIDMINADSTEAVNAAYRLMTGKLTSKIREIQERLTSVLSGLEAVLDYPEELEDETLPEALDELVEINRNLLAFTKQKAYGRLVKNGIDVALVGDTNVGKSSIMNAMLGYERAIVSDIRGTTRDFVSESTEYNGKKINITDTAGVRESEDQIEREGVNRAFSIIKTAKIVIYVHDAGEKNDKNEMLEDALKGKNVINVYNKCDVFDAPKDTFKVSAKTGEGIDKLLNKIVEIFDREKAPEGEVLTSERQLFAIAEAYKMIDDGIEALRSGVTTDCVLSVLTEAWKKLGEITGETVSEKIIDDIFDKFCVGK